MVFNPFGVNADVAFDKVETRAVKETADRIRTNIQTVNLVIIILQQTFSQMVTDKTVNPQDQHAGTTFHGNKRTAGEQRARYQTHRRRKLSPLHVNAVCALAGNDFQRAFTTGHYKRGDGQHGAWLRRRQIGTHAGFPDDKFVGAHIAKRARPRIADRTHQVMQLLRRFFPGQTTIFRGTTANIGGLRFILCTLLSLAAADFRQHVAQQAL